MILLESIVQVDIRPVTDVAGRCRAAAANGRRPLPVLWADPVMGAPRTRRAADVVERSIPWRRASLSDRHACRFLWLSEWRAPTTATPYGCPVLLAG
jgi:hypothetical protein